MLVALALSAAALAADPDAPPVQVAPAGGPITIDGALDEPGWAAAEPVTDFLRFQPVEGGPPGGETAVRFLQDDETLYIGVTVRGAGYPIRARLSPRESINDDDQIGIYLDTFNDARSGYIFYLNAIGIQQDIRFNNGSWSMNWDTVFSSKGQVDGDDFTLEIAMPFRSLRFPSGGEPQEWGLILTRKIPSEGAKYSAPEIVRNHPQMFAQAMPLQGVVPPARGAGPEILPVMAVRQDATREDPASEPLEWSGLDPWNEAIKPGADLRFGLTPDTGLAATVNPDFSQVEGDATQVNLNQRFAFFYPEQRPFFLDGVDAFQDRISTLYTRSIVEPIYGVKVTGREGKVSFGALNALDLSPAGSIHELGTPGFSSDDVAEAMAMNTAHRGRVDAFNGGYVGWTLADKRTLGGASGGGAFNDVWGVDARIPLGGRWGSSAHSSWSVYGDGDGETALGWHNGAMVYRSSGVGWGFYLLGADISQDYRREMGFHTQSGFSKGQTGVDYTFEPDGFLDTLQPELSVQATSERSGDAFEMAEFELDAVRGVSSAGLWTSAFRTVQDGVEDPGWEFGGYVGSNPAKWLRFEATALRASELDFGLLVPAEATRLSGSLTLRAGPAVRLDTTAQQEWFTPEAEPTEVGTALRSRLTWQFTPTWGLRLIGEGTNSDGDLGLSSSQMLTWIRHPGTEAYIGATQATTPDGLADLSLFAKLSWLFRL